MFVSHVRNLAIAHPPANFAAWLKYSTLIRLFLSLLLSWYFSNHGVCIAALRFESTMVAFYFLVVMGTPIKDVSIDESKVHDLMLSKHSDFIHSYSKKTEDYEYIMTEYLRMSGIYWGLTAMNLMSSLDRMDRQVPTYTTMMPNTSRMWML